MSAAYKFGIIAAGVLAGGSCSEAGHIYVICRHIGDEKNILAAACVAPGPDGWFAHSFRGAADVGWVPRMALINHLHRCLIGIQHGASYVWAMMAVTLGVGYNIAPGNRSIIAPRRRGSDAAMPPPAAVESKSVADLDIIILTAHSETDAADSRYIAAKRGYPRCAAALDEIGNRKILCLAFRGGRPIGAAVIELYDFHCFGDADMADGGNLVVVETSTTTARMMFMAIRRHMRFTAWRTAADTGRGIAHGLNIVSRHINVETNEVTFTLDMPFPAARSRAASV